MKKTLLAVVLGTLTIATTANANWYVQGDLGVSKTEIQDADIKKTHFEPRISVGYKLQDFRLALDYTHYKNLTDNYGIAGVKGNSETKIRGIGLSAIYDIPVEISVKPYVGVRLAINRLELEDNYIENSTANYDSYKETGLGYGAVVGVQYPLIQNLHLNAGLEYNRLGKIDDAKVNNYGAKVGLRYDF
ncbi:opacity protein-like surface antigen [Cricetibacter osteomyelitidis]|uniref:Opacity protein-like surface antigen n=1 Tax=Cricetibacter osteomyelitidis TaxID=1521931 RepID=A0A4R2SSJ9_9PAST|nr:opacity family porin [Cricetibacter osteomyelitidis]TCP93317.1 opacity protein-like surface antigen [Cricetibacter osteomyelitidis]